MTASIGPGSAATCDGSAGGSGPQAPKSSAGVAFIPNFGGGPQDIYKGPTMMQRKSACLAPPVQSLVEPDFMYLIPLASISAG